MKMYVDISHKSGHEKAPLTNVAKSALNMFEKQSWNKNNILLYNTIITYRSESLSYNIQTHNQI